MPRRKNARDYRGEEWIVHDVAAEEADAIVRQHARPGFAVSVVIANDGPDEPTRTAYKALGYRWRSMATPSSGVCAA
ncbi:hypothetical protein NKJ16_21035 [Mesorhizobium sp. M0179]|uniref:hypothetical protein n=1 Tax=Mesorhizobium sp. M0179 TaxID=2956905 RepID=UPI00333A4A4B